MEVENLTMVWPKIRRERNTFNNLVMYFFFRDDGNHLPISCQMLILEEY